MALRTFHATIQHFFDNNLRGSHLLKLYLRRRLHVIVSEDPELVLEQLFLPGVSFTLRVVFTWVVVWAVHNDLFRKGADRQPATPLVVPIPNMRIVAEHVPCVSAVLTESMLG